MKTVLIAPRKYVQGRGVLMELGDHLKLLGNKAMVLWDPLVKQIVGETVRASLANSGVDLLAVEFTGESSPAERQRVTGIAREGGADIAVGIGGGKVLDVAKAAAIDADIAMVTCPTIASNDSPTSAASVWYDDEHNFVGFDCWSRNPDLVLVDTWVIVGAPVRTLVNGMGDAISTWVETEAAYRTRAKNLAGGVPTRVAYAIARLAFETLLECGETAKRDAELGLVTPAVERAVEANTLMSGLGFESGGLATAHMVGNLLSNVPQCKEAGLMHGEKVSFGIVTQLCLDDEVEADDRNVVFDLLIRLGLPVTFAGVSLEGATRDELRWVAEACAGEGSLCANHAFEVTADDVLDAMFAADALGRELTSHTERDGGPVGCCGHGGC